MSVKARLIQFLKKKNLSQSKFEEMTNLSTGYVSSIGKGINTISLAKIKAAFPELNTDWLQSGTGNMEEVEVLDLGETIKRISVTNDVILATVAEILAVVRNQSTTVIRAGLEKLVTDKMNEPSAQSQESATE